MSPFQANNSSIFLIILILREIFKYPTEYTIYVINTNFISQYKIYSYIYIINYILNILKKVY